MTLVRARVASAVELTPRMRRITLTGDGLGAFGGDRPADAVKLVLPPGGRGLPPEASWDAGGLHVGDDAELRTYTVRRLHRESRRLEIDAVVHGHGPGSTWAAHAAPGDPVTFIGPRRDYPAADEPDLLLIVGDEATIPAAAGIVESLRPGQCAQVFLEVADSADEQVFDTLGDVTVSWLHRAGEVSVLADAVRAFRLPPGRTRAWVAAETASALAVRRHLRTELGLPREDVSAFGYWQRDHTADDAHDVPEE